MILLGVETATAVCGIALVEGGTVLAEKWVEERFAHAEKIFGLLDDVLGTAHERLRDVQGIAVSIGPGSFTGLRIGLSVVKGLHLATGVPVVAVPTLWPLAQNAEREARAMGAGSILAVLDARRGEVYRQLFTVASDAVHASSGVCDAEVARLGECLPEGKVAVTGEARMQALTALLRSGHDPSRIVAVSESSARCSAAAVARYGAGLFAAGAAADIAVLEPHYIKDFFLRIPE